MKLKDIKLYEGMELTFVTDEQITIRPNDIIRIKLGDISGGSLVFAEVHQALSGERIPLKGVDVE